MRHRREKHIVLFMISPSVLPMIIRVHNLDVGMNNLSMLRFTHLDVKEARIPRLDSLGEPDESMRVRIGIAIVCILMHDRVMTDVSLGCSRDVRKQLFMVDVALEREMNTGSFQEKLGLVVLRHAGKKDKNFHCHVGV